MFTTLNDNGRKKLAESIRKFGNEKTIAGLETIRGCLGMWELEVMEKCDIEGNSSLEINSSFSKTGNPVIVKFSAEDFNVDQF